MTITRESIVRAIRAAVEPHDWARAVYVAGSAAFGRVDRWSDVDVGIAVADGRVEDGFAAVESALASLAPIETCWRINAPAHEKPQRVYRLAGADPFLLVDVGVLPESTPPAKRFVERRRHGAPRVIFDRVGFTADVPGDPDALRARLRGRLEELKLRFAMTQTHPQKAALRGEVAEAVTFYQAFTLRPLVEALRMRHDPWRHDFDVRYLRFDLPADVRRRLEPLWLVRDLDDLLAKRAAAEIWFREIVTGLDVDAIDLRSASSIRVRRLPDAAAFLDAAGAFLVEREAYHNLVLGIAHTCRRDPTRYPGPNYFAVVEDAGRIVGTATMTPPHHLQVYVPPGAAVDAVAADVAAGGWSPTGAGGPVESASAFANRWTSTRGGRAVVRMNLRAFELNEVVDPPRPPGAPRTATADDLPIVEAWYDAFHEEAGMPSASISWGEIARRSVREGRVFVWDDGGPVAQTVVVGSTPNGARIGAVYTPPELRRRGYATALVADVSRLQLAAGRKFCFLFTDLANPVSNSIYPKVGYRPVADYRDFDFVAEGSA